MSEEKITGVCVDIPTLIKEAKEGKWISVKERMPEDHCGCLFVDSKGSVCFGYRTSQVDPIFWDSLDNESRTATYWQPLPAPPKDCSST